MIDAWDIYWVMQLDTIRIVAVLATCALGGSALFTAMGRAMAFDYGLSKEEKAEAWAAAIKAIKKLALLAVIPALLSAFLPSTKTAAAMIVAPAIVNNEAIQREAGDLYVLAKQALAEAVKPDKPKSDE